MDFESLDPLITVKAAFQKGSINKKLFELITKRFQIVTQGIDRIEKASGINFPIAYVEPSIIISPSSTNPNEYGILFARTIPLVFDDKLQVVIQISAPLVAYGLKGSIHAILAHEFLHYLELINKISKMEILSDEISGNLFENIFSDETKLFEPKAVFKDKTLLLHITKKFPFGFKDYKLEDKVLKFWIEKNLPTINMTLDSNMVKISAESLTKIKLEPDLIKKIETIKLKSTKIQKKKYY